MKKFIQKRQRLNYGSASEHVDYYPIFLWGVCRGAGKEKKIFHWNHLEGCNSAATFPVEGAN